VASGKPFIFNPNLSAMVSVCSDYRSAMVSGWSEYNIGFCYSVATVHCDCSFCF